MSLRAFCERKPGLGAGGKGLRKSRSLLLSSSLLSGDSKPTEHDRADAGGAEVERGLPALVSPEGWVTQAQRGELVGDTGGTCDETVEECSVWLKEKGQEGT